jgi:hypothetical protein
MVDLTPIYFIHKSMGDTGIEFRGLLSADIDYRMGVSRGFREIRWEYRQIG